MHPASQPDLDALVGHLCHRLGDNLVAVYLYGSFAKGCAGPESDIDLAILTRKPVSQRLLWDVAQELVRLSGRDVDLVDLGRVPTVLQMQVILEGKRLLCRDRFACELFETHVFSDYVDLNERRGPILADIRQRGSVHG